MSTMWRNCRAFGAVILGLAALGGLCAAAAAQGRPPVETPVAPAPGFIEIMPTGMLADTGAEDYANKVVACFAEGTSPDYVDLINARVDTINAAILGQRYQLNSRWTGVNGSPQALTWSFAPDGLSIPNGIGEGVANNTLFATMDAQFGGNRALWISRFQAVFDRWQALSGVTYTRVTSGGNDWDDGASWGSSGAAGLRGDIRICAKPMDGGSGVLAYNYFPGTGIGGNMHLDNAESWGSSSNLHRFLRNIVAHEHGHGIGLSHVCPADATKLMEPFISTAYDGPRHDEIRGAQRWYGDPFEDDNTAGTANPIGTLTFGVAVTPCNLPAPISGSNPGSSSNCSVDFDGESDYWSFAVTGPATCNVTMTPLGFTYEDCAQAGDCSVATCMSSTNSLTIGNLAVQVLSTNGTTVIVDASAGAVGVAETITGASLPSAGTYFVRVYETSAQTQSQMYSLSITATSAACTPPSITTNPTTQTACSGGSVTFTVAASGTAPFAYQWRKNAVNIGGATSTSLIINPVAVGDAGSYDCVVTNACGSATSTAATLTVNTAPSITSQPQSASVCAHDPVTFSVTATGTGLGYQWRKNTVNIGGATMTSYTISSPIASDAGSYDVIVSNSCGSVTSAAATLTVTGTIKGDANCDGFVNNFDIDSFVLALTQGQAAWEAQFGCGFLCTLDISGDGSVNNFDIDPFVGCITSGCP